MFGGRIIGSRQSHNHLHNKLRALTMRDSLSSLLITINPADLHSPICRNKLMSNL